MSSSSNKPKLQIQQTVPSNSQESGRIAPPNTAPNTPMAVSGLNQGQNFTYNQPINIPINFGSNKSNLSSNNPSNHTANPEGTRAPPTTPFVPSEGSKFEYLPLNLNKKSSVKEVKSVQEVQEVEEMGES